MRNIQPVAGGGGYDFNYWKGRAAGADRYHCGGASPCTALVPNAFVLDRLYAVPCYNTRSCTIDRIAAYITGAGVNAKVRLGAYTNVSNYNPYPGTLILDAEIVVGAGSGLQWISAPLSLSGSTLYWLAFVVTHVNPASYYSTTSGLFPVGGVNTSFQSEAIGFYYAYGYAAMPASYAAGATRCENASMPVPALSVRYAS